MRPAGLLLAFLVGLEFLLSAPSAVAQTPGTPQPDVQRREMRHRKRRIIYNNDGNDVFLKTLSGPEDFLQQRIEPALGTQVDAIFYCTLVTTLYQHDTEVAERWDDLATAINTTDKYAVNARDNMRMLRAAGADCLKLVVDRCRQAGVEIFWSHRINDIHDCFTPSLLSQWKRRHPECLLGEEGDNRRYPASDPRNRWTALDFEKSEVREYLHRINEEICRRYDVDGIEIDYFRNPCFFRPTMTLQPATPEQLNILTDFQRRTREMARAQGERRGRPILLATRVPMTVATCRFVGIDIETWLSEDLVDLLVTGGGYVPFTMPTRELAELGRAHDVPVYPTISASGMTGRYGSPEAWKGAASNAWHAGADGIYTFNIFPSQPNHWAFTTLGDPEPLSSMDKLFAIDNRPVLAGGLTQAIEQSQILPVTLDSDGKPRQVTLPVGDDLPDAAAAGRLAGVSLHMEFSSKAPTDKLEVRLNDEDIEPAEEKDGWVTCRVEPTRFRQGDNTFELRVLARDPAASDPIVLRSVELRVDYK
ncbi:MAG: hypothetical protein V2A58_08500 [Planctomycetota bacterium]